MANMTPEFGRQIAQFRGQYFFLSNFYPAKVKYAGQMYPTVEHAYQAAKYTDPDQQKEVHDTDTPARARRIGRKYHPREDWEQVKVSIMEDLLRQKFLNDDYARIRLVESRLMLIRHYNWWGDQFWGIESVSKIGQNMLGKLLMKIRDELDHTVVVNIRKEEYDVYCGRRRNQKHRHYGNPASHLPRTDALVPVQTREQAVEFHEEWLEGKHPTIEPKRRVWVLNRLPTLMGKRLGCYCAPLPCHVDNYVRRIEHARPPRLL